MTDREYAETQDAQDVLAGFRQRFALPESDLVYLDGASLGMLPLATRDRLREVIEVEWGQELVRGWQHWVDLPHTVGDRVGSLVGAAAGQVVVCDSISVNLFKLASAALDAQPGRKVIVTDLSNFPSDRYVLAGAAERRKGQLRLVPGDPAQGITTDRVHTYLADDVALVALSHVDFRTGSVADVKALTDQAHAAGALVLWDLAHSAGCVSLELDALGVDLAVGCSYKYLNAGPGAPGFLYVRRELQDRLRNPIQGWWSVKDMFDMDAGYRPADGIGRFLTGTPSVPGLIAVDEGAKLVGEAGIARIRAKSILLTEYLVKLADAWLTPLGFSIQSPREETRRGGHVVLAHDDAYRISIAAGQAGVITDSRPPNLIRIAPSPLTTAFVDVWEGLSRIRDVVASNAYLALPDERARVT
ncbi:MAG TPA: kynureninase [Actinomycetes bacterium]|nr:kynureninase [Actinomycetes bacterium]